MAVRLGSVASWIRTRLRVRRGGSPGSRFLRCGYNQVPFNIGSRVGGPWPIAHDQMNILESRDQVRVVATNVNLNAGTPNFFLAVLIGYEFPNP